MGFMEKAITGKMEWWQTDTSEGTFFYPAEDFSREEIARTFPDEGMELLEKVTGYGACLTAPGFLDATEWTVFDTVEEAEKYLDEMYGEEL